MIIFRRLTLLILALPYVFSFVLLTVLSPITWALTGKNWDQQAEAYADFGDRAIEWASSK